MSTAASSNDAARPASGSCRSIEVNMVTSSLGTDFLIAKFSADKWAQQVRRLQRSDGDADFAEVETKHGTSRIDVG
jgi:hypothetical protein